MGVLLVLSGVGLLLLPAATRPLGRQLPPDRWARLCVVALMAGAALVELSAALYAAPTLFRAAGVPSIAALCERMLGPLVPGGAYAGWASASFALTMPILAVVGIRRARRTQRIVHAEPWLGRHVDWQGYDLVVLPTPQPVAISLHGTTDQIIVSEGLLAFLEPDAVDAVLRHEAAHLEKGHHRYLLAATAVDHALAFLPVVRRSTHVLRTSLERWADEVAAGGVPAERHVLRTALLEVSRAMVAPTAMAAFSTADTIVERVEALAHEVTPMRRLSRIALYTPGVALGVTAVVALGAWAADAQMVLAMAGRCPAA
ncbi:MAG: M56 family metallopeptidase [Acidimicrobiales bacterium]